VPKGPLAIEPWLKGLKEGRTFATNGPLLGLTLGDRQVGEELRLPAGENQVKFHAWMRSLVPIDHLQVVCNGEVVRDLNASPGEPEVTTDGTIPLTRSGWCVLRAWSEKAEHPVLDLYPYATTSPIYVNVAGSVTRSPEDAAYFMAWIDRLTEAANSSQEWNTAAEKTAILDLLTYARKVYEQMSK